MLVCTIVVVVSGAKKIIVESEGEFERDSPEFLDTTPVVCYKQQPDATPGVMTSDHLVYIIRVRLATSRSLPPNLLLSGAQAVVGEGQACSDRRDPRHHCRGCRTFEERGQVRSRKAVGRGGAAG